MEMKNSNITTGIKWNFYMGMKNSNITTGDTLYWANYKPSGLAHPLPGFACFPWLPRKTELIIGR